MSVLDREFLTKMSLSQAELARALRISRQAVCVGVNKEEAYLDANQLFRLYDFFVVQGDRRASIVVNLLQTHHGIKVDKIMAGTTNGHPDSLPDDVKEVWILAEKPLELTSIPYASLMRQHFASHDKTFVYFVGDPNTGHHLAGRLEHEINAVKRDYKQNAKIYIVLCNAVMVMPHFAILNPRKSGARGYVKVATGSFVEIDCKEVGRIVSNIMIAGVRVEDDKLLPAGMNGVSVLDDGLSFRVLHEF